MKKIYLFSTVLAMLSCTTETYDTGDGDLSYLRADLVMMHTARAKAVDRLITDDGQTLQLPQPVTVSWAERADPLYRALAYYNDNKPAQRIEVKSIQPVYVLHPRLSEGTAGGAKADPVGIESTWMSTGGLFINLALLLKSGQPDSDDARHVIGVVIDSETDDAITLTFDHDQGGVPPYYTSRLYASIPVSETMKNKTVILNVHTYDGLKTFTFPAPHT